MNVLAAKAMKHVAAIASVATTTMLVAIRSTPSIVFAIISGNRQSPTTATNYAGVACVASKKHVVGIAAASVVAAATVVVAHVHGHASVHSSSRGRCHDTASHVAALLLCMWMLRLHCVHCVEHHEGRRTQAEATCPATSHGRRVNAAYRSRCMDRVRSMAVTIFFATARPGMLLHHQQPLQLWPGNMKFTRTVCR